MAYPLNDRQLTCVRHGEGPLLVLAGAGSGKTGVIVNRITQLISRGIPPASICAVTFTNKAAKEMRERVRDLVGKNPRGIFIGTFHSLGLLILRENQEAAGVGKNFSIMGQDDQLTLAREVLVQSGVDTERCDLFRIRGDGDEMFGDCFRIAAKAAERPIPRALRVGHRLQCCEGLRRNDEESLFRVQIVCGLDKISAVDI